MLREVHKEQDYSQKLRQGASYKEHRAKFDQIAKDWSSREMSAHQSATIHDELSEIESHHKGIQDRKCWGQVVQKTRNDCRVCGAKIPTNYLVERRNVQKFFPERIEDEIPEPCPSCGSDPWARDCDISPQAMIFKPYFDVSLGADAKCPSGVRYVKGRGHEITSLSKLREFARANGREFR